MITFAAGGTLDRLDGERDCLANVDAFARPVPAAMAMTGREFEMLTEGGAEEPDMVALGRVVAARAMALPALVPGSGPFRHRRGGWSPEAARLGPAEKAAAASLYAALIAETCLGLAGAEGPVIVEGPFARNRIFLSGLASLIGRPVIARADATGTTAGAALLAFGPEGAERIADPPPVAPLDLDIAAYAAEWRARAGA
jgi:sugar (pentulose or hexulose) kinase